MELVIQQEKTGCALACVAMLAGTTYEHVRREYHTMGYAVDDDRLWSETEYIRALLHHFSIEVADRQVPFSSWADLPDRALLAVKHHCRDGRNFWHWTLFARKEHQETVYDPKKGLKENMRRDFGRIRPAWYIEVFRGP